jgi:hypothetical protein
MDETGLELRDGIEAKEVIVTQLARALEVIRRHNPTRIVTLGGMRGQCRAVRRTCAPLRRGPGDRVD